MKGFDDHLDNYGDPNPGDPNPFEWDDTWGFVNLPDDDDDDGITTDDFDNWPQGRGFPS